MDRDIRFYIIGAGLVLTMMISSVMLGMAYKQDRLIRQQTYEQASALFESIVMTRRWNAGYGGVYAEKRPGDVSNPYLDEPDILGVNGKVYTKKNPALMTKEISRLAEEGGKFNFHITSLVLKNPENAPDEWEKMALESFARGNPDAAEVITEGDRHFYRLMKPLYVEDSCLECHKDQGYVVGDVRGGISVTLPFDGPYHALVGNLLGMAGIAVLLVVLLVSVLYFFVWRLMERLSRQKRELMKLNETKDRFLGMAAHDLRNPLVVVNGYTELLQGSISDRDHSELLEGIAISADRMLRLIDDLLDTAKIKSGKLDLYLSEVDVAEFVHECLRLYETIAKKKDISLRHEVSAALGVALFDRQRMHQVIDNLLSNAFKFSRPGTEVVLGAEKSDGFFRLWVQDSGVGIKEDELPYIFDEFTKISARPTAGEASHGLGLAIVKRMVELHGGSIRVESEPGRGTRFTITLPLIQKP